MIIIPSQSRTNLMENIFNIWVEQRGANQCYGSVIQEIENKIYMYAWNNDLNLTEYTAMIYRVCMFLIRSNSFDVRIKKIDTEIKFKELIDDIKNMKMQNMIRFDEEAFESILIEIEMRKADIIKSEISNAFTCRYCGKNETTYYIIQLRASDEPPTAIYKCIHCRNNGRTSL